MTKKPILTPMKRTTLTSGICEKLIGHIVRGEWAEGTRLPPERELCEMLGVGRSSLREALKALEIMGLIDSRLGSGTVVLRRSEFLSQPLLWAIASNSEVEVEELTEARRLMEVELAGLAAQRATSEDLENIGRFLEEMESAMEDKDHFLTADINFHVAIAKAAHNRILYNALELIRNLMRQWISNALRLNSVAEEALDQHKSIFVAIAGKNTEKARTQMAAHLTIMGQHLAESRGSAPR